MKLLSIIALVGICFTSAEEDKNSQYGASYETEPIPYTFSWKVEDPPSQNNYAHEESSDGRTAIGAYQVLLPDGRTQIVNYVADEEGYNPTVKYVNSGVAYKYENPKKEVYLDKVLQGDERSGYDKLKYIKEKGYKKSGQTKTEYGKPSYESISVTKQNYKLENAKPNPGSSYSEVNYKLPSDYGSRINPDNYDETHKVPVYNIVTRPLYSVPGPPYDEDYDSGEIQLHKDQRREQPKDRKNYQDVYSGLEKLPVTDRYEKYHPHKSENNHIQPKDSIDETPVYRPQKQSGTHEEREFKTPVYTLSDYHKSLKYHVENKGASKRPGIKILSKSSQLQANEASVGESIYGSDGLSELKYADITDYRGSEYGKPVGNRPTSHFRLQANPAKASDFRKSENHNYKPKYD